MKYTVKISQLAIVQSGYDMDLVDGAVFDMLSDYTNAPSCQKKADGGAIYFNVPYKKVIEELPMAGLKTPDSVYRRFKKLEQFGIIQFHPDNKKTKQVWFGWGRNYEALHFKDVTGSKSEQPQKQTGFKSDVATHNEFRPDGNPVQTGSKSGVRPDGNPTHNNTYPNTFPNVECTNTPFSENGKAAVTTYTPDQIENVAVTVVDFESLEAEKEPKVHIPPAAGAEIETESQAQSTYDLYASLEAKKKTPPIPAAPLKEKETRKTRATKPAADRSAEISAHLGTDELREFFVAIQPEWAKWVEYKAIEKRFRYKSHKTEAETITELAGDTNFDAERAKAAIRYSRAKTWAGIFVKDEKTKTAPAPRYSFADAPQAHTTQELLTEMRSFYKTNKGELTGTQAAAGTAYTDNRLTEAVTAFCAHRVSIGKAAESFERQNAALCKWLQEEKKRDAAKVAGPGVPTVQYSTRAAAPIRYAKLEENRTE